MDRKEVGFACAEGHVTGTVIVEEGRYRQVIRCRTLSAKTQMQCLEKAYAMEEAHELTEPPAYEWYAPEDWERARLRNRDISWVKEGGLLMRARRGKAA